MPLIEVKNASKVYTSAKGTRQVLEHVNLSIEEGEFLSIVGYSGSGKSTLIGITSGLFPVSSGDVKIGGIPVRGFAQRASIVFQNYSLLPWFSAIENVRLAVEAAFPDWGKEKQRSQAAKYLEMVGLSTAFEKRPGQLSGGMRQRVAIARAFATEPQVLFLDEPFGALDALTRANLQQELARMAGAAGCPVTTLMITNSVDEAILLSDRIVPMSRGPRATLGPAISVPIPRPRTAAMLTHDEEAIRIQARVVEFLTGFSHAAGTRSPAESRAVPQVSPVEMTSEAKL